MVQKWIKFVRKENNKVLILETISQILSGNFSWLDIIKVSWKQWYYRCRIWKIRIIFFEKNWEYYVSGVWYRGDIYK